MVELTDDGIAGRLDVRAGRSHFSLATLPREDFPIMASAEYSCNFACPAPVLRRLFDKAKFAISTEETRYYLNGVYMHAAKGPDGPVLRCVATDGHRLARIDAALPRGRRGVAGGHRAAQDRGRAAQAARRRRDDHRGLGQRDQGAVRDAGDHADIEGDRRHVPGLRPRDPDRQHAGGWRWTPAEFAQAVDRVATVSSERSRAVKMSLDDDRLVLSVNAPDAGAADEELSVAYGDERLEIGFNAKYLLEIAGQVDRENAVFLFNSAGDPTLMREGNDDTAVYVVMPMRV